MSTTRIPWLLSLILVFTTLFGSYAPAASAASATLGQTLTDWVLDEANGYLYAIAKDTDKLLFIRTSDLTVAQELVVGTAPTDIDLQAGKLYIPLSGAATASAVVVDTATQTIEKTLTLSAKPYKMALDGDKLFYIDSGSWAYIYVHNLSTGVNTKIGTTSYYNPDLALDPVSHTLYVGESGTSGGKVAAIRTSDYVKLSQSTYNDGYGFSYPSRKVIADGKDVFYAKSQLDGSKLSTINGHYGEQVIYVKGNYVFSPSAVYDRNTFTYMGLLPVNASLAVSDSAGNTYLFEASMQTIQKVQLSYKLPVESYTPAGHRLDLPFSLSDWVYDEKTDTIYAVSQDGNRLLYLNAGTLDVTREVFVGSAPSDIDLYEGKLYIALSGATKAVVYDAATATPVTSYALDHNPYRIEITADKLFTVGYDQWENLRTYNLLTGAITKKSTTYYAPELLIDRTAGTLYLGESGLSGSDLLAFRTSDLTQVGQSNYDNGYGFPYPGRYMTKDGTDLYFGKFRLAANSLTTVLTTYPEQIIGAKDNRVFGMTGIYDRDTAVKTYDLPHSASLVAVRPNGSFLTFSPDQNAIFLDVAPQLLSTAPTDGAKDIPVDKAVTVQFSEAVKAGPAYDKISFTDAAGQEVPVIRDLTGNTLTLTPDMPLAFDAVYTVTIPAGAVMDGPGQISVDSATFSFTTAPVQAKDEFPAVTSAATVDGVTTITFSEDVTAGKAYDVIELTDADGNRVLISVVLNGNTLTLTPKAQLVSGAVYNVFLAAASVQDATGNAMAASFTHSFTY